MKKIINAIALLSTVLFMTACGGNQTKSAKPIEVDVLLAEAEQLTGSEVTVEGVCTHICSHGGRKIFLMGSDDKHTIRIEAGEKIGSFKPECVNNLVRVTGMMIEERIDEAYLAGWEQMIKENAAEKHGDGEEGCSTERQARGEEAANTTEKRIEAFRARIAERKEKEGKDYLSFYYIDGTSYEVLQ